MSIKIAINGGILDQGIQGPIAPSTPDASHWLVDRLADGTNTVGSWLVDLFGTKLGGWLAQLLDHGLTILNANSPEIITFAIVVCAGGMMIAPLFGSHPSKWFGRAMGTFWIGVIWRVLGS
ncbi:hypothetical protein DNHGIG_26120 [Collibacillus ludicampi]|uniref:Uncharacterized protein n=1 Tax=Collibacillus ludicampi TaxID=2771369 RepID=A0AAV4LH33_9BACL|nr:hypothetical protein [Collibacillus ludicampi]GIM47063.1 hypothetical protein DNHGIG_26120 [Collibacillus ludicampi]